MNSNTLDDTRIERLVELSSISADLIGLGLCPDKSFTTVNKVRDKLRAFSEKINKDYEQFTKRIKFYEVRELQKEKLERIRELRAEIELLERTLV